MSEKKVKEQHQAGPSVVAQTTIEVLNDGSVRVHGFPSDMGRALSLMGMATHAMMNFFMEQAKSGGENQIIIPKSLVLVQGKKDQ